MVLIFNVNLSLENLWWIIHNDYGDDEYNYDYEAYDKKFFIDIIIVLGDFCYNICTLRWFWDLDFIDRFLVDLLEISAWRHYPLSLNNW